MDIKDRIPNEPEHIRVLIATIATIFKVKKVSAEDGIRVCELIAEYTKQYGTN